MGVIDWPARLWQIGGYFRLGMEARACRTLAYYVEQLLVEFPKIPAEYTGNLQVLLGQTLAAQERRDFLMVADLLEYEIPPILNLALPHDADKKG